MNQSKSYADWLHMPIAAAIMAVGVAITHYAGWVWALAFLTFVACYWREWTQEEYREIEARGGLRANLPPLWGALPWQWNRHSIIETVLSGVTVIAIGVVLTQLGWG